MAPGRFSHRMPIDKFTLQSSSLYTEGIEYRPQLGDLT
jgi:hypothetical protein